MHSGQLECCTVFQASPIASTRPSGPKLRPHTPPNMSVIYRKSTATLLWSNVEGVHCQRSLPFPTSPVYFRKQEKMAHSATN